MDDTQPTGTTSADPRPISVRAVEALEGATWLDKTVDVEQRLAEKALTAPPGLLGLLRGRGVGHAVHPPMTDVPIGTWLSASALDLVGGRAARPAARLLVGLGCLAALPTFVTGTAEWVGLREGDKRVGYVHAVANGTSFAAYTASWWVRRHEASHGLGVALALAGGAIAGIGGYLGGHLSVSRDIGSRDPAYAGDPTSREPVSPNRD